ncbi:uncharacterized protein [Diadema antillarum]|uniref:uncharacterized protein n=1 Tax=Diadema antillarum TaxID=105358 RepID=UPI003A8B0BB4
MQPQQQAYPAYPPQQQPPVYMPPPAGQTVVVAQAQPMQTNYVVQGAPPSNEGCCSGISEKFNANGGFVTGVIQTIVAVLSIILGGVSYAFPGIWYSGYGIWSGILFFMPTGILGICSKRRQTGVVVAYLVMSIICCLEAVGMIGYEGAAAGVSSFYYTCDYVYSSYYGSRYTCDYETNSGAVAVHSILAIAAFVEFVVAIVASAICCGGLRCCCASPTTTTTTTTTYYTGQPQPQQQFVVQPAQPPAQAYPAKA